MSIDIFDQRDPDDPQPGSRIASGTRRTLFVPQLNRLYLAVPDRQSQRAEIPVSAPRS